jgi:hypothetical protein
MTLTIFAIPKAFRGQFEHIQLSAVESWTRLDPRPEIILFGDDPGTAEVAARFGLRHQPDVERNEHGTPRVDRLFATAQAIASNDLICYINSDIILTQRFIDSVSRVESLEANKPFLGVGRKTSLPITEPIDFTKADWAARLEEWAAREGREVTYDSDFFLFRRSHFPSMPPFAIGRCYWSSWFMWDTRRRGLDLVDLTGEVLSVEPRHDYSHAKSTGGHARLSGVEYEANRRLFRGCHYYTTVNATHSLTPDGLARAPASYTPLSYRVRLTYWIYFLLKGRWYPYSLPLILAGRWALAGLRRARTLRPGTGTA